MMFYVEVIVEFLLHIILQGPGDGFVDVRHPFSNVTDASYHLEAHSELGHGMHVLQQSHGVEHFVLDEVVWRVVDGYSSSSRRSYRVLGDEVVPERFHRLGERNIDLVGYGIQDVGGDVIHSVNFSSMSSFATRNML